jgi:hypothetical protein
MKYLTKELMEKWVEALRSGRYQQGIGKLRSIDDGQYCCLGVLCDILPPEAGRWKYETSFEFDNPTTWINSSTSSANLAGIVGEEFDLLFGQPAVIKTLLNQINLTFWSAVHFKSTFDTAQQLFMLLNDLTTPNNIKQANPERLPPVPFKVLADWIEVAINVADFTVSPTITQRTPDPSLFI